MMGLGGAIGTGLFMGSGIAIGYAGPSVVLSYAIAGFIAFVMVFSLSEMAVVHPAAGSFGVYAEHYLNPWAGFVVRYTYWFVQIVAVGGEAIAAGVYMTYWFPGTPIWLWSIGFAFTLVYVNARSVSDFGTFEYWFALIKVVAIVLFIILGSASILGIGLEPVGFHNLTGLPGGFMPHGWGGMWMAVIMGVFAFNGVEVIAVTAGEVRHPETAIPAALRNMVVRLFLFYVLALGIVVTFVPWTATGAKVVAESPFVSVLGYAGLSHAAGIMNFVVLSAALSSMNVNVYLSSRMLFSLSRGGYAPTFLGRLGPNRRATRGDPRLGRRHPAGCCDRESDPAGVQLPVRRRPVRCNGRLDLHPAESSQLPASSRRRRPAGAHAVLPIPADRRARAAGCGAGHDGTRHGVLEHLVDRRRPVVVAGFRGVLSLARTPTPRRHDRKCGMTLLPSSSIAACGSGPSGPPKPISSSPLARSSSTLAMTSSGVPTMPSLSIWSVTRHLAPA